jgi:eukaryotic-like serine/threonine-protein kinase
VAHDNPGGMADELIAGRYRLIEPLGRGSMSAVWLAEDEELQRRVAVKTLAPSADRERFAREARAVAALSHPNICALYDYGADETRPFMVLEYFPNGSLEDRLRRESPLSDDETARIATEIAAGLAHAHERGLVHRDLKPANILFDGEQRAKIADFGIASMAGTGTLTDAGTVLGTASYISPEQATGLPAGPASDVYSFGVILFRMLTGRLPFTSTNAMELVRMHRDDPPPPVSAFRSDAPARLEALVAESLRKDPRERPQDGAALYAALRGDETASTMILGSEPTRVIPRPARRRRNSAVPLAGLAAALLIAGAGLAYALTQSNDGPTAPPPSLSVPVVSSATVSTAESTSTTVPSTTAPTTTARTTTRPAPPPPTTFPTTTAVTTTTPVPPTTSVTLPTTTEPPPTTTAETTTVATTTDTTTPTTTG